MTSELTKSPGNVVAPPRPKEIPRPGTVEESYAGLVFHLNHAERGEELFDQVIFFVI